MFPNDGERYLMILNLHFRFKCRTYLSLMAYLDCDAILLIDVANFTF